MSRSKWILLVVVFLIFTTITAIVVMERYSYHNSSRKPTNAYLHSRIKKYKIQGIDISHHQGDIDWEEVKHPDTTQELKFVFIRATVGIDNDKRFTENWNGAGNAQLSRGAYHYYWSDVNSTTQANHFIETVKLVKGDLPPVLDIEDISSIQNVTSLRKGLKNWIQLVEDHYGVKPIIYTGDSFYHSFLEPDSYFKSYPNLWIANYNRVDLPDADWDFWQYTDRMPINGVETLVDANVFKGSLNKFNRLLVP